MIGCGTVGSGVAQLLRDQKDLYTTRVGRTIELVAVLVRNVDKAKNTGLLQDIAVTNDPDAFFANDMDIVLEVAGGIDPISQYVQRALTAGCHVVTANKALLAAQGPELFRLAKQHNASIALEASCGGGIPIVTALTFGLMANRFEALYGILNGTCNYILTEMTQKGKTYETALAEAQEKGFAEADPAMDVSGQDAAQKLAILAAIAFGVQITEEQVHSIGINNLNLEDIQFGAELGYDIKLLAIAQQTNAGLSLGVRPCFIHADLPLAQVHGSFNALSVYGNATGHSMYYGRGAGQFPTAGAIVSDLLNLVGQGYAPAFGQMNLWPTDQPAATVASADELTSRFYLRVDVPDVPNVMAKLTRALGEAGISISAVMQHEIDAGNHVPVVILTHQARQGDVLKAIKAMKTQLSMPTEPTLIHIVDFPEG